MSIQAPINVLKGKKNYKAFMWRNHQNVMIIYFKNGFRTKLFISVVVKHYD